MKPNYTTYCIWFSGSLVLYFLKWGHMNSHMNRDGVQLSYTMPLGGYNFFSTTKSPGVSYSHVINLRGMKGFVDFGDTQWF